jgi:FtsP/CotA-like multicopper oxidase with cupredoxin domain
LTVVYPTTDQYPDCFNESIFTNVHFHGTHTSPQSTGDNVFLQFAPMPRAASTARTLMPDPNQGTAFRDLFARCETELASSTMPKIWPRLWNDTPSIVPGAPPLALGVPDSFKKWMTDSLTNAGATVWRQQNSNAIVNGAFPQNYIGAYPYCYRLPECDADNCKPDSTAATSAHTHGAGAAEMDETQAPQRPLQMAQVPGTHWYHAHKHGSTTINVTNGMTGVFLIEGQYDDAIKADFGGQINTKVMVIGQLGGTPFLARGAGGSDPYFSVNGQLQPVITMAPGEIQWWRIANTSARAGVYFLSPSATCQPTDKALTWKQIAQDGVQFNNTNYTAAWNNCAAFFLASGNRADLLVRAPNTPNDYPVLVYNSVDSTDRLPAATKNRVLGITNGADPTRLTLATVRVTSSANNMSFPAQAPPFPGFLKNIDRVQATRELVFESVNNSGGPGNPAQHTIDGKLFDGEVGAAIVLNQNEEWKIVNKTFPNGNNSLISHPFHIHINPFQVTEIFDPNAQVMIGGSLQNVYVTTTPADPSKQCQIDPGNEATWKPCSAVAPPPTVWWDVFAIPSGNVFSGVKISGYFKMRSRFVDYPGYYVLHCHILAHEDRGMMTVVYVTPLQPPFSHH